MVWKFQDFSITQILREINLWESRSVKSVILTHFEALNFDFYAFLYLLKAEIRQKWKFSATNCVKMTNFTLLEFPKLVSRKIRVIEKLWNFHTVLTLHFYVKSVLGKMWSLKNYKVSLLEAHSVYTEGISGFTCHSDFTWN